MHSLYLPGNNPSNREVAFELAQNMPGFESSTVIEYPHWNSSDPSGGIVDLNETSKSLVDVFGGADKDFMVIAKSIGVNLCLHTQFSDQSFNPSQAVFIGAAINEEVRKHNPVAEWLEGYDTPSLWLQNANDPVFPAEDLREYLSDIGLQEAEIVSLDGDSHEYEPALVSEVIKQRLELSQTPE